MPDWITTQKRKSSQLQIALNAEVLDHPRLDNGFGAVRFIPEALPEIDLHQVATGTILFGRRMRAPILISSMTGGTADGGRINRTLARAAQSNGLAMGLGSCRVLLENADLLSTFDVRKLAPDVLLFANLGAVQLRRGVTADDCRWLVESLRADGLILHLNALQEALQAEGDSDFADVLAGIEAMTASLSVPVVVKEVGFGIAPDTVRRLLAAGVAAVDLAAAGGTAWNSIEADRHEERWRVDLCHDFDDWGLSCADAIREARLEAPDGILFASGGVRTGVEVAKAIALGADLVGIGRPLLRVAIEGEEAVDAYVMRLVEGLRITMFGIGASNLHELRQTRRLVRCSQ